MRGSNRSSTVSHRLPNRESSSRRSSLNQHDDSRNYKYVKLKLNREQRYADLTVHAPKVRSQRTPKEIQELGDAYWPLQAYRELDDALLHLRVNEPLIGLVCLRTEGDAETVLAVDETLAANRITGWCARSCCTWRACFDVSISPRRVSLRSSNREVASPETCSNCCSLRIAVTC